jgi:starch synthase (maltosyl-transferring)
MTGRADLRLGITDVAPVVSCGSFSARAVVGEHLPITATVFREGHDAVAANGGDRDGLRRRLPAADPPDRQVNRKGRNNTLDAGPDDRLAVGDRQRRGRPRRRPPRARHDRGLRRLRRARAASSAWRSRSTSRCSARPTTRG